MCNISIFCIFVWQAQNDQCQSIGDADDAKWPPLTWEGQWKTIQVQLKTGLNVLHWKTIGIDTHSSARPVMIKSIRISGGSLNNHVFSEVFRRLVRLGSFPACCRQANVTPIPKGPPSSSDPNYRPISIASVLFKVFERLVTFQLGRFMERSVVFQPSSLIGYLRSVEKITQKLPFYTFYSISYYYICNVLSFVICFNYINFNSPYIATQCVC